MVARAPQCQNTRLAALLKPCHAASIACWLTGGSGQLAIHAVAAVFKFVPVIYFASLRMVAPRVERAAKQNHATLKAALSTAAYQRGVRGMSARRAVDRAPRHERGLSRLHRPMVAAYVVH